MFPVPVDADSISESAVSRTDRPHVGLEALGRLVDFPEFALGQALVLTFFTNWRDRIQCQSTGYKRSAIYLIIPIPITPYP